jgi:hypothetical protein
MRRLFWATGVVVMGLSCGEGSHSGASPDAVGGTSFGPSAGGDAASEAGASSTGAGAEASASGGDGGGIGNDAAGSDAVGGAPRGGASPGGAGSNLGGSSVGGGGGSPAFEPPPELVWTAESQEGPFAGIWGSSPDDIYAGGINGRMIHWDGSKWAIQNAKPLAGEHITGVWGSGPNDVYASVNANVLFHTTGDGTWEHIGFSGSISFSDIWGTGPNNVYAVGGGGVYHFAGSGAWTLTRLGDDYGIDKIWGVGEAELWAESYYGQVTHYVDGKQTGQPVGGQYGKFTMDSFYDVWASGPSDIYVVGRNSIMHSHGSKTDWVNEYPADLGQDSVMSIWGFDAHTIYATTTKGSLLRSAGDGRWLSQVIDSGGSSTSFPGLWGTSPSNMYLSMNFRIYHGVPR